MIRVKRSLVLLMVVVAVACATFSAVPQTVTTFQNTPISIELKSMGATGPVDYSVETSPANGRLAGTPPFLTYTPDDGFVGTDSFTFKASTMIGDASKEEIATITINVNEMMGGDGQIDTMIKSVKVYGDSVVITTKDVFLSSCSSNNQVVIANDADSLAFMAALDGLVISKPVTIFTDGCLDVSGMSLSKVLDILVLTNQG